MPGMCHHTCLLSFYHILHSRWTENITVYDNSYICILLFLCYKDNVSCFKENAFKRTRKKKKKLFSCLALTSNSIPQRQLLNGLIFLCPLSFFPELLGLDHLVEDLFSYFVYSSCSCSWTRELGKGPTYAFVRNYGLDNFLVWNSSMCQLVGLKTVWIPIRFPASGYFCLQSNYPFILWVFLATFFFFFFKSQPGGPLIPWLIQENSFTRWEWSVTHMSLHLQKLESLRGIWPGIWKWFTEKKQKESSSFWFPVQWPAWVTMAHWLTLIKRDCAKRDKINQMAQTNQKLRESSSGDEAGV